METTKSIRLNQYGQAILTSDNLRDLLLQGKNINRSNIVNDEEIELFNKYQEALLKETITLSEEADNISYDKFHENCSNEWLFPAKYQSIDVHKWLLDKCKTSEEIDRVEQEYLLYEERDLVMLLRLFIFVVDYFRKNNFVWGIGRGSSVNSYILYLIGIHRVDSILYELRIEDFLK